MLFNDWRSTAQCKMDVWLANVRRRLVIFPLISNQIPRQSHKLCLDLTKAAIVFVICLVVLVVKQERRVTSTAIAVWFVAWRGERCRYLLHAYLQLKWHYRYMFLVWCRVLLSIGRTSRQCCSATVAGCACLSSVDACF